MSLRYKAQSFELSIPLSSQRVTRRTLANLEEAFGREHQRTYGHRAAPNEPVEIVTLHLIGRGISKKPRIPDKITLPQPTVPAQSKRRVYLGPQKGWIEVPVLSREDLKKRKKGPCIIEEYDATCIVPIGAIARLDPFGNVVVTLH